MCDAIISRQTTQSARAVLLAEDEELDDAEEEEDEPLDFELLLLDALTPIEVGPSAVSKAKTTVLNWPSNSSSWKRRSRHI